MLGVGQPRLGPDYHGHLQLVGALSPGERGLQVLRHLQGRAVEVQSAVIQLWEGRVCHRVAPSQWAGDF